MLQDCFKDYTGKFQGPFKQVKEFRDAVKDVSRVFFGRFKGVSRVFQRSFKDVSFQEIV